MKELINDIGMKKILMIAGIFVGVIVLIIVCLMLYNSLFAGTSYSKIENTLVSAARDYYKKNPKLMPQTSGGSVSVNATTLAANKHMKDLSEYTKKINSAISCTGSVTVTEVNGKYRYTPNLKCGDQYETKTLVSQIRSNEELVITGQGLYEMNGGYVFRGDAPNNFVDFSDRIWNIVKIQDDYIYMIMRDSKDIKSQWDNRYNVNRNTTSGINDYSVSRIKTYLDSLYNSTLLNEQSKMLLSPYNAPVGKRDESVMANDGSIENSTIEENTYLGLLPLYDFINASIDANCNSAASKSCANYNYLSYLVGSWWTATGNSATTHQVYKIENGKISSSTTNTSSRVRPVVRLVKDALFVSGDGTETNPYKVK